MTKWICQVCTLENEASLLECNACLTPNPQLERLQREILKSKLAPNDIAWREQLQKEDVVDAVYRDPYLLKLYWLPAVVREIEGDIVYFHYMEIGEGMLLKINRFSLELAQGLSKTTQLNDDPGAQSIPPTTEKCSCPTCRAARGDQTSTSTSTSTRQKTATRSRWWL
mmetsp:Transcript_12726/g.24514  ORF Transcript_12726/g.24514 Transcript_12726/m.24514 type:complete len:168 (+) Transcript_12726:880-1383(+)